MTTAYPLDWPEAWARTPHHKQQRSRFDVTLFKAAEQLLAEIRRSGGVNIVISSNVPVRNDGLPRSDRNQPVDAGVAVYFTRAGAEHCIPCDKWDLPGDNMRAIAKTLEALRGIERWGAKSMVDAAYRGFQALPPPAGVAPQTPWWQVLGVPRGTPLDVAELVYRDRARKAHPDAGGNADAMAELNRAIKQARELAKGEAA